jgi:hypothetical protein
MEQLQCALLGFFGEIITEDGVSTAAPDSPFTSPSDVALIASAVPMARDYESLSAFRERGAGGRLRGFYTASLAVAVDDVLRLYESDVLAMDDARGILALRTRYSALLRKVVAITQTNDTQQRLRQLHALCSEPRLPLDLRCTISDRVCIALLRNLAHWVAHGEVLDPTDFFVVPSEEKADDGSARQWDADRDRVPPGWPDTLLAHAVVAGKERRLLLRESSDLLNRHEMTEQERDRERGDAAAVFARLSDPQLIDGGAIVLDELERRVRAAHQHWSSIIWRSVKQRFRLLDQLEAVRDMYLCRRGDLWHSFITAAAPVLFAKHYSEGPAAVNARLALDQRVVTMAFQNSMLATGLAEHPLYRSFAMAFREAPLPAAPTAAGQGQTSTGGGGGGEPLSLDAIGAATLGNVRRLALQFRLPPGMALIVSPNAQRRYVRLFALHIALKLALYGLCEVRRFAGIVSRSYGTSRLLRKLLLLTGALHYFLTNVAFCLQVDVQDTHFKALMAALAQVTAVETARRAHEAFMDELYAGAFLQQDGVDVARSIDAAIILALGLYVVTQRDTTQAVIRASAGSNQAHGSVVHAENEVHSVLSYVSLQLRRRVTAAVVPSISLDTRPAHRALWTRLDFNRWLSEEAIRAAEGDAAAAEPHQAHVDPRLTEARPRPQAAEERRTTVPRTEGARPTTSRVDATGPLVERRADGTVRVSSSTRTTAALPMGQQQLQQQQQTAGTPYYHPPPRDATTAAAAASALQRAPSSADVSSVETSVVGLARPSTRLSASAAAAVAARREARQQQPPQPRGPHGAGTDDVEV